MKVALGDPALRRSLEDFVRRRVPASDVDDVVQTVLCDALAASAPPRESGELKRWLLGIARHKVVDLHRRAHREPPAELPDLEDSPAPIEARELVRWAERQAGDKDDAKKTLDWMAREGEGEKLEAIAADEQVPAARVRQRVSRMRRWMKERWAAELAAVAMLAILALAAWYLLKKPGQPPEAKDTPEPQPTIAPEPRPDLDRARALRAEALEACDRSAWRECLDGLDQARSLDPVGDQAPAVGAARARAAAALTAPPSTVAPSALPPLPTSSSTLPSVKPEPTGKLDSKESDGFDEKFEGKKASKSSVKPAPTAAPAKKTGTGTPGGTGYGKGVKKRASTTVLDSPGFDSKPQ